MPALKDSVVGVLSKFTWGQTLITILVVLGTILVIGQALEILLPKAWKEKVDAVENNSIVAAAIKFFRAFSYLSPDKWPASDDVKVESKK